MASSIWPYDYYKQLHDINRNDPFGLVVFLASPFSPEEKYKDLHEFCQLVCNELARQIGNPISCERGDTPPTPEIIHQDIWNYIQRSDALIFDISDQNPNVMIEIGVASAIRDKNQVILIKDAETDLKQIFDISPARYLTYNRKLIFDRKFFNQLINALRVSLVPAPYKPKKVENFQLPINITHENPETYNKMLSPSSSHWRKTIEGLEFGSLNFFQYSWLTLGEEDFSNIHLRVKLKFIEISPRLTGGDAWIGISLRSQHFFANFGHLIYLRDDGAIIYARPLDDNGKNEDLLLGKIQNFDPNQWVDFEIIFTENVLKISINDLTKIFQMQEKTDMPFCYKAGMIRFQTYKSKACIQSINADYPKDAQ